jgi:hypothetical protein
MNDIYSRIPDVARRRPTWRWLKRLALGVLVLAVGLAIHSAFRYYRTTGALRQMWADLDRADPGWRMEEIEALREAIPDAENGGLIVRDTLPLMPVDWPPSSTRDFLKVPPPEQYSDADFARLEAELIPLEPALAVARDLALRPRGRLPLEYARNPLQTRLPAQSLAKRLNHLLVLDARRQAQGGRMREAVQSCRAALNAARTLGDEPMMISQQIRMGCVLDACQAVEYTLAQGEPDPQDLEPMQGLLEREDAHDPLRTALRGERAILEQVFELVESGELPLARLDPQFNSRPFDTREYFQEKYLPWLTTCDIRTEHTRLLSLMTQHVWVASLPLPEQAIAESALDAERIGLLSGTRLAGILMPVVPRFGDYCRCYHALVRCLLVAVGAERFRRAHGHWPASLSALVPQFVRAVPLDPFDGKPLRYRKLPDGVVVYSSGPDETDNGGQVDRDKLARPGTDLGCRLWDVKQRRQPPRPAPAAPPNGVFR